ncbi:branched-chain amino acid ABC transporter substrate-binding protein [Rhizobacter sp. SG703]|uniref:branched-chain amino acid ABC transporter substrate-binding protein n=1 Tax=Rhizobacter sp. SG703 TaxID=2587140 RepID=UPI0014470EAF|nr:branched-chain amino acid ABC transporter substrate-binding protein [Rhizobacter sp. SG703]NKI93570.1 branched-chain amino acid transport system substrate-binding protein [Rhizobacter sp. SG703]
MRIFRPARLSSVVAAASLALLAACGPSIPPTIKIGVAQPLSGPSAARGQDLLNGVKMAADELNASGFKVAGKVVKIEVVAVDDKADKETAKKVAQELVDQKVTAVIGHLSSDISEVTIPIYKGANIPQLYTSSAVDLAKLGDGNTFRLVANDGLQARAIGGYIAESLNANNVAIVFEDTAFGRPMSKDVSEALGKLKKKVTLNESVNNKTTDFAAFVAKLKATPPDVLVAVLRDNQLLPLFEQMKAAGLSGVPVLSTNSSKTEKLAKAPNDVTTLYVTSSALEPREFAAGPAFLKKFQTVFKADPVWGAHYAYDAMYVIADAMRRSDSVDPIKLREKLHSIDPVSPVTSSMRFTADGEQAYGAITVYRRRDGQWEPLMRSDRW